MTNDPKGLINELIYWLLVIFIIVLLIALIRWAWGEMG